jgi:predicted RNA-binding protein with PUA-like domain
VENLGGKIKKSSIATLPESKTLFFILCWRNFCDLALFFTTAHFPLPFPLSRKKPGKFNQYSIVMSQYWMVKQEPTAYSWNQFAADGKTDWTGVRNFQARNNLRSMKLGDSVFYYHSVNGKAVVGIAKVTKEAFRDPTAAEGDWSAVELTAVKPIDPPVTVEQIKKEPRLSEMPLLRNSRLSVMPLTKGQFETILELAKAATL